MNKSEFKTATQQQADSKQLPVHSILWWSIKVACGTALIASLFLMFIYDFGVLFRVPMLFAQSLVIVGGFTSLWHYQILKESNNNIAHPNKMVSNKGLFRYVRHPMYLADAIAYTGLFLIAPNPITTVVLLLAYFALFRQSTVEDGVLAETFGSQFSEWRNKSKLILPFVY